MSTRLFLFLLVVLLSIKLSTSKPLNDDEDVSLDPIDPIGQLPTTTHSSAINPTTRPRLLNGAL